MSLFRSLETFAAVAESRSFSEAAHKLRLTPSAVSKQIAALEQELKVTLILRNTHGLALTDSGNILLGRARRILSEVAEAKDMVSGYSEAPRGMLRVAAPATFGRLFVSPLVAPFLKLYPDVRIELRLNERLTDPISSGVDIALRIGSLDDSNLVAVKLAPFRRVLCASPRYVDAHGYPESPEDIARHNCLVNTRYAARNTWYFVRDGVTSKAVVNGTFRANNSGALIDAVLGGLGLGLAGTWLAGSYIQSGELVPLLTEWTARTTKEPLDISAFYPKSTHKSPAVRAFTQFLRKHYGTPPAWDAPLITAGAITVD